MEIAQAYATLARAGVPEPIHLLSAPGNQPALRPWLSAATCQATLAAISGYARTATLSPRAASLHAAWKTGTSSGHRDAWCAAVTSRFTVVVWLGNSGGWGSTALVGQDAAAPVALNLLAALCGRDGAPIIQSDVGRPAPPAPSNLTAARPMPVSPRVIIISPAAGQEYVLSPDLDAAHQQVMLHAVFRGDPSDSRVWWFVDGVTLGQFPVDDAVPWHPAPGTHQVRAIDSSGHAAVLQFTVRG
jgi:penicillin-binding protein 1C